MKIIDDTELAVRALVRGVEAIEEHAARNGYRIENGEVVETGRSEGVLTAATLRMEVRVILDQAAAIDAELNSVLESILSREIDDAGAATLVAAAQAGDDHIVDEQRHRDLLARYQVRTDGTTMWPSGLTGWLAERAGYTKEQITNAEVKMLDDLQARKGLMGLKEFADIRQDALHVAEGRFGGKGLTDGHADAFRHAYWNALMTQRYGEQWACEFATAHERNPASHHVPVAMDLHNNEVGRQIARAHPDAGPEELASLVEQAVKDGRMVVIDNNGTLAPSHEVKPGETYDTENKPWSRENPDRGDDHDPGEPSAIPEQY
ncbi:hypothetical protein LX15_000304 [Streptoalloteichus tenebrarius]|uniref:DUF6973 domain-containing protein n=1 Tax=Streptoalloteichus tenebrarius (strain ATCC 17920 / DSM 40477 / JCM 4838 / CBS 697.72 / NBRC 16177 / NCIMB 11028 / NRRL B-12390 / A12253. 1 / ISP 5477) TaxID=1933 RepID=A0ABT1HM90_STRSD|nr:wnt family protein [Streptoalloteichus tenebrarius]MCP2256621.1 hypothetical protein [Streptoalloteichus tenebrarius]BFF04974.1 hypothetical protein GCM10020241_66490 [Streptoalloteichus tenebrarius]